MHCSNPFCRFVSLLARLFGPHQLAGSSALHGGWAETMYGILSIAICVVLLVPCCLFALRLWAVKQRINAVGNVKKITKAMQLIASSKVKAAERRMLLARSFAVRFDACVHLLFIVGLIVIACRKILLALGRSKSRRLRARNT